ncbi:MAG: 1-deoxy-D-xylulose-5-phosphate synthase [Fimbriimonadaceae bacterium]|nr:1-deoxy-D-xylulose-5-phosphate synthase [Fimbriimonadaceae bacterium]
MSRTPKPLLDGLRGPHDLKGLQPAQLEELCREVRQDIVEVIRALPCGGHFGANLGTVELTVALHYLFDSPRDKLIWDVGHQSYPHKMLTGRVGRLSTIRQKDGLAPFCKPAESEHDIFGAGHGGTSISAALGFALARDLAGEDSHVVAVIGDGSLTAGMSFEGLNHAGDLNTRLIVVVNDNGMGISPNVGALSNYLTQVRVGKPFNEVKSAFESLLHRLPLGDELLEGIERVDQTMRHAMLPSIYFEDLGFEYLGPIDGHHLDNLLRTFRYAKTRQRPVVIHVMTEKGKGFPAAEADEGKMHAVKPSSSGPKVAAYTDVFVEMFDALAARDERVVGVTAAMLDGTGLVKLQAKYPTRILDVGMAEQHAVTLSAALAIGGRRPIAAIYSTFLQRAYDQILHDVALHNAPVIFALDRAGLVGNDGPTHMGLYDFAYLRHIPNLVLAAARDENELRHLLHTALLHTDSPVASPIAVRYPRDNVWQLDPPAELRCLPLGVGEILREGSGTAVLAIGTPAVSAWRAAEQLAASGLDLTVADGRWLKPLDTKLVLDLASRHERLITVEDHSVVGGFGSAVAEVLASAGCGCPLHVLGVPDEWVEHADRSEQLAQFRLDTAGLAQQFQAICEGRPSGLQLVG